MQQNTMKSDLVSGRYCFGNRKYPGYWPSCRLPWFWSRHLGSLGSGTKEPMQACLRASVTTAFHTYPESLCMVQRRLLRHERALGDNLVTVYTATQSVHACYQTILETVSQKLRSIQWCASSTVLTESDQSCCVLTFLLLSGTPTKWTNALSHCIFHHQWDYAVASRAGSCICCGKYEHGSKHTCTCILPDTAFMSACVYTWNKAFPQRLPAKYPLPHCIDSWWSVRCSAYLQGYDTRPQTHKLKPSLAKVHTSGISQYSVLSPSYKRPYVSVPLQTTGPAA